MSCSLSWGVSKSLSTKSRLEDKEEEKEGEDLESKPINAEETSDEVEEGTSNEKLVRVEGEGEDDDGGPKREEGGEGEEGEENPTKADELSDPTEGGSEEDDE